MTTTKPREYHVLEVNGVNIKTVDVEAYQAAQEEIEALKSKLARYEEALKNISNCSLTSPDIMKMYADEARQALGGE